MAEWVTKPDAGKAAVVEEADEGGRAFADETGLSVPSAPRSIALVRRYAVDACHAYGWGDSADTVALLVTEVATNAVLYAYGSHVRVRVLDLGLRLRVEVFDASPTLPVPRGARAKDEGGRGLGLVEALAVAWGVEPSPAGKTTWFEVGV
jgi:anti-sigma regulatory factor (Ser/Thr protein kinase)